MPPTREGRIRNDRVARSVLLDNAEPDLGRLGVYRSGKGAVSGFGEAVLDRALGDEQFVIARLARLRVNGPMRTKDWAREAIAWLSPEVCWAVRTDRAFALELEDRVEKALKAHGLWNEASMRRSAPRGPL